MIKYCIDSSNNYFPSRPLDAIKNLIRLECEVNDFPAVDTTLLRLVEVITEGLDVPGLFENDTILTAGIILICCLSPDRQCYSEA